MKSVKNQLMDQVRTDEGCWEWTGYRNNGYGRLTISGRCEYAHRTMWRLVVSEIPPGIGVLHHCDNPGCVRPDHLFLGTQKVNGEDMKQKGRSSSGSKNGMSKLTVADVVKIRSMTGTNSSVAGVFGVRDNTISRIRSGVRWGNVC